MKVTITISIDKEILKKIDEERGLVSRSTYLNEILKQVLGGDEGGEARNT